MFQVEFKGRKRPMPQLKGSQEKGIHSSLLLSLFVLLSSTDWIKSIHTRVGGLLYSVYSNVNLFQNTVTDISTVTLDQISGH